MTFRHTNKMMVQSLVKVDNHGVKVEACGVAKYKVFEGFKKKHTRLGHNAFTFNYKLAIS